MKRQRLRENHEERKLGASGGLHGTSRNSCFNSTLFEETPHPASSLGPTTCQAWGPLLLPKGEGRPFPSPVGRGFSEFSRQVSGRPFSLSRGERVSRCIGTGEGSLRLRLRRIVPPSLLLIGSLVRQHEQLSCNWLGTTTDG